MKTKIPDWINAESKELDEAFKKKLLEEGKRPFFKFPVGETRIKIDVSVTPRLTENGKKCLRGIIKGEEWDIPFSEVLYRKVINYLNIGFDEFIIVRVGEGKNDTKYDIKNCADDDGSSSDGTT